MSDFPSWCLAQIPVQDTWDIKRVGMHRANRTWKLEGKQHTLIVKRYRYDSVFGRSFQQLVELDDTIAETGIGPELIWSSPGEGVVVSKYIAPPMLNMMDDRNFAVKQLADISARIHQLRPQQIKWDLHRRVERYCDSLGKAEPRKAEQFRQDCADYQPLFDSWAAHPGVFCHNDLIAEHVFPGPPCKVIDWEYAGYGHPGFDLASTIVSNDMDDQEANQFLEHYREAGGDPLTADDIKDWMRLVALVNHIWFTLQESLRTREHGKEDTGTLI